MGGTWGLGGMGTWGLGDKGLDKDIYLGTYIWGHGLGQEEKDFTQSMYIYIYLFIYIYVDMCDYIDILIVM